MALSGHVVGLLKEYMRDLVEQAKQETAAHASFGFSATPYRSDQALSDLLALFWTIASNPKGCKLDCRTGFSTRCGGCVTMPAPR